MANFSRFSLDKTAASVSGISGIVGVKAFADWTPLVSPSQMLSEHRRNQQKKI